jgi:hypothetical protein
MLFTRPVFSFRRAITNILVVVTASLSAFAPLIGCGSSLAVETKAAVGPQPVSASVSSASPTVQVSQTAAFVAMSNGSAATGGTWQVMGGQSNGIIDSKGIYQAPSTVPNPANVSVCYVLSNTPFCANITVVSPVVAAPVLVKASQPSVTTGLTDRMSATQAGVAATGGQWTVDGGIGNGSIDQAGLYQAPSAVPSPASVSVCYLLSNVSSCDVITVTAPLGATPIVVAANQPTVTTGQTDLMTATQDGAAVTGGQWTVGGGIANGSIDQTGLYVAPQSVPAQPVVSIGYVVAGTTYSATVTVIAPVIPPPAITTISPGALTALSTSIQITGTGFESSSMVTINTIPVATTYVDPSHLVATAVLSLPTSETVSIAVVNPGPPSLISATYYLNATFPVLSVSPSPLSGGNVTLTISGSGFVKGDIVFLGDQPMQTAVDSSSQITAVGFLTPWTTGTVVVEVRASDGLTPLSAISVPISPTAVSFDVAARFTTQAAFGPRPDLVAHIQQVGLDAFITEQFAQPAITYPLSNGAHTFVTGAISGNSLLRQRVALALQTFIVGTNYDFGPSSTFLETKFENDATGNFRNLLLDIVSDPDLANFLNLAKNNASNNSLNPPNQNAARELMQLFSIGTLMLNDDGSVQSDGDGNALPSYTQDTVVAMTAALTGWQEPVIVNTATTHVGVDYSQTLNPSDAKHDHNAKVLFGNVSLPAGQTIIQDRDMALDAIFNHPNVPPFISRLLIQQLVTSNPSPEYIQRISKVFEDDGTGIRGNMAAIIRAILLDSEARAGDMKPNPNDGFLQSPFKFQLFAMSALQDSGSDDQVLYTAGTLGEKWWYSPTVFYFFSPTSNVPGTSIHSPEFMLFNNLSAIQRSQVLWGIVSSTLPGYTNDYKPTSWLFQNFKTVPTMIDALNHLLYHGQMSQTEQAAITQYCAQLNSKDLNLQLESAVFLGLNADSYNVSH